jgi:hypothetical protein
VGPWVREEVGHRLQRDDPLCRSGTVQGTWLSGNGQGQCCTRNPERTDVQEETSGEIGRHQLHKEPRCKTAATSEDGDDNRHRHQRTKQETGATSGKHDHIT